MIYLLVKLARFVTHKEQESIARDLTHSLSKYSKSVNIVSDTWGSRNRLLIHLPNETKLSSEIRKNILRNPGVNNLVIFYQNNFEFETNSLTQLITYLEEFIGKATDNNTVTAYYQAFGRVPFHRKAILDRLKKKGIIQSSNSNFHLYLEVKKSSQTKDGKMPIKARLGEKLIPISSPKRTNLPPTLILYSPYTIQEVADFFRLALTFKTKILLTDENNIVTKVVEQVENTFFKGITKIEYEIVPSLNKILQEHENDTFYGFSLWGSLPINELPGMIKSGGAKMKNLFFVFGNEEKGLPLEVRKEIQMVRIGDKASEPLRASQAAAYTLGMLNI
ncbi:MAG: TrmH family RNA methyltransferase [Candidatus Hodarchaeales archaeon]|jgi:tRNA(Leu) C34 or U34 (ribose-2'-O)-methylase TrmL